MLKNKSHLTIEWNGAQYLIAELKAGETLLELALRKDWPIDHSCGGNGTCGTCRVRVVESKPSLPSRNEVEEELASDRGFEPHERLSCQMELEHLEYLKLDIPT